MALTVNNGEGTTPNTALSGAPSVYGAYEGNPAAWYGLKQLYVMEWVETEPGVYTKTWRQVGDWEAPTVTVPGVGITQGSSFDPPDAKVYWTVVGSGDYRYSYSVRVEWYRNGVYDWADQVPQSTGNVTRFFSMWDQVYAVVRYVNSAGSGPTTQTATLQL